MDLHVRGEDVALCSRGCRDAGYSRRYGGPRFGPQLDGELNTLLDEPSVVASDPVEDQDWADLVETVEGWADGQEGP